MMSKIVDMTPLSIFLMLSLSLVKFSYLPKFHVNIITGSGVMTIYFDKGLTRNPKIEIPTFELFVHYLETGPN